MAGFWLLDQRDFGIKFTLPDSIHRTLLYLTWAGDPRLASRTPYAAWFLDSLYALSAAVIAYAGFVFFRPVIYRYRTLPRERALAFVNVIPSYHSGEATIDLMRHRVRRGVEAEMTDSFARNSGKSIFRNWRYAIGWLLAAAGLIWVLHDIHPSRLARQLAGIDWRWVALALTCDLLAYLIQAVRWQLLLAPVGKISLLQAMQAIYAGLFTSEVMPMRPGEFVRIYIVSQWMGASLVTILPSIILERLFDGVWIAMGIGLAAIFAPLPKDLIEAGETFGAVIALIVALFIYLVLRRPRPRRGGRPADRGMLRWKPLRAIAGLFRRLGEGLREASRTKEFFLSFALSLPFLALQAISLWLIMMGYGLRHSIWVGVVVYVIVSLGTSLPNTPANIGSYQFFAVLGLTLFGVDKTSATGFSLVAFMLLSLPLLVIGFLALSRSGMSLAAVREELRRPERRADL